MTLITQVWQRILFAENCRLAQTDLNPPPYHHEKPTALVFTLANILCAHIGRYRWLRTPANTGQHAGESTRGRLHFYRAAFYECLKNDDRPLDRRLHH